MLFQIVIALGCLRLALSSISPTLSPTLSPTFSPTRIPSRIPTHLPSVLPSYVRSSQNNLYVVAGTGDAGTSGNGGLATSATVNKPYSVWEDSIGNLYFGDGQGHDVRKISLSSRVVSLVAGSGNAAYGGDEGPATSAQFNLIVGMMVNTLGVIYISDCVNGRLRKVSSGGIVTTLMGRGVATNDGDGSSSTSATIYAPTGVWCDSTGVLFVNNFSGGCRLRKIDALGIVTTLAGGGSGSYSTVAAVATSSNLSDLERVVVDSSGKIYLSVAGHNYVAYVSNAGSISVKIGSGMSGTQSSILENVAATSVDLAYPTGMFIDSANGDFYIANRNSYRIQVLTPATSLVTTYAGSGVASGSVTTGVAATSATINSPEGLCLDSTGNLYIGEYDLDYIFVVYSVSPTIAPTALHYFTFSSYVTYSDVAIYSGVGSDISVFYVVSATANGAYINVGLSQPYDVCEDPSAQTSTTKIYYFMYTGQKYVKVQFTLISNVIYWKAINARYYSVGVPTCSDLISTGYPLSVAADLATSSGSAGYGVQSIVFNIGTVPTSQPSRQPSSQPSRRPTMQPTSQPTSKPSRPTMSPTAAPSPVRSSQNYIATIAGTGEQASDGTGGPATSASFDSPRNVWGDTLGTIYVVEAACVRKFVLGVGIVANYAGLCGATGSFSGSGGPATSIGLHNALGISFSTTGALFVASYGDHRVIQVSSFGRATSYVGTGVCGTTGDGGQATSAAFCNPYGLWMNSAGQLYLSSFSAQVAKTVSALGIITSVAGIDGSSGFTGDGGAATSAQLNGPEHVLSDSNGYLYVADSGNNRVRMVNSGMASTVLGNGGTSYQGDGYKATSTSLNHVAGLALDSSNFDLYVSALSDGRIVALTRSSGLVYTFAGSGSTGTSDGDGGQATAAVLPGPDGLYLDALKRLFIGTYGVHKVRYVYSFNPSMSPSTVPTRVPTAVPSTIRSSNNLLSNIAGTGTASSTGTGGKATSATFYYPRSAWGDTSGTVYVAEIKADCVRKFNSATGIVSNYIGVCGSGGVFTAGLPATSTKLLYPMSMFLTTSGVMYLTSNHDNRVLRIVSSNQVENCIGTGTNATNGDDGPATSASLNDPDGVWVNSMGQVYVSVFADHVVKMVSVTGTIFTVLGSSGTYGFSGDGGPGTSAIIRRPERLFGDSTGLVYLTDYGNNRVRTLSTSNIVVTTLGSGGTTYSGDGLTATSVSFASPCGMAIDTSNYDFYISSTVGYRIIVLTKSSGLVYNYAGTGTSGTDSTDGVAATAAVLVTPDGIFLDTSGRMYVPNGNENRVHVIYSVVPTLMPTVSPSTLQPTALHFTTYSAYVTTADVMIYSGAGSDFSVFSVVSANANGASVGSSWSVELICPDTTVQTSTTRTYYFAVFGMKFVKVQFTLSSGAVYWKAVGVRASGISVGSCDYLLSSYLSATAYSLATCSSCSDFGIESIVFTVANAPTSQPSRQPSSKPTCQPTLQPLRQPTRQPSSQPTSQPTMQPNLRPSTHPTCQPTFQPSMQPSIHPTSLPSSQPSLQPLINPTGQPSQQPTVKPTSRPSSKPTIQPTRIPSQQPTTQPTAQPSCQPIMQPTSRPSSQPSMKPSMQPLTQPSGNPSLQPLTVPSVQPSLQPSSQPSEQPSSQPTMQPFSKPTWQPSSRPSEQPTGQPSVQPFAEPSRQPSSQPIYQPTGQPTDIPSAQPSAGPSSQPSAHPSCQPTEQPSRQPLAVPTSQPSSYPSTLPSTQPNSIPSVQPSRQPSRQPSTQPTAQPIRSPTSQPTSQPSRRPSSQPSSQPAPKPTTQPSVQPSGQPNIKPTSQPSAVPSTQPYSIPSSQPQNSPTSQPSRQPTMKPSTRPTRQPSCQPSAQPTRIPASQPSKQPSSQPSIIPTLQPMGQPSSRPSCIPSSCPTEEPTMVPINPSKPPTLAPSNLPSLNPSLIPSAILTDLPTVSPTDSPTVKPTRFPTLIPSIVPSRVPSLTPSIGPSRIPSVSPSLIPSCDPTLIPSPDPTAVSKAPSVTNKPTSPTRAPTRGPTLLPSLKPSMVPSLVPSLKPTQLPSVKPTLKPTRLPSLVPSRKPSALPTFRTSTNPSVNPSYRPSLMPTTPTVSPTQPRPSISPSPTVEPSLSLEPTVEPSDAPSIGPTPGPSVLPTTVLPSFAPSVLPSIAPTAEPSVIPTALPSTQAPSAAPSTLEYFETHAKATLPSNQTISVTGVDAEHFKIVLPWPSTRDSVGAAFSDVELKPGFNGSAFVAFGEANLPSTTNADIRGTYEGMVGIDSITRSVSVLPDINDDGYEDLIIGAPNTARCYVMFGSAAGLTDMNSGFTVFGVLDGDLTGWSVSGAGDVNNDTINDFMVGAPMVNGKGAVYVIYGRRRNNFDVYLSNFSYTQGFVLYGTQKSDYLGVSVSGVGDVNKDGVDDVIAGAVMTSLMNAGAAYVIFGGRSLNNVASSQLTASQGFRIVGTSSYMYLGCSVSGAGDMNGDKIDDFVIGTSPQKNFLVPTTYVLFGSTRIGSVSLSTLTTAQGVRFTGAGVMVSAGGDVNGDGFDDLVLGGGLSSSVQGSIVFFTNVSHFNILTSPPSVLPTMRPSPSPTVMPTTRAPVMPSIRPTRQPTESPSAEPSAPTDSPTPGASEPSSWPSSLPTHPTVAPSQAPSEIPSEPPSQEPSEEPSMSPTMEPSEIPSIVPTEAPSEIPTVVATNEPTTEGPTFAVMTREPFGVPTVVPTVTSTEPIVYTVATINEPGTVINQSEPNINYVVNTTGQVTILNAKGGNKYTIVPQDASIVQIVYFEKSTDVIDITTYKSITSFDKLIITEGSIVVTLSTQQTLRILNLHVGDINAKNFVFYVDTGKDTKNQIEKFGERATLILALVLSLAGFVAMVWYGRAYYDEWNKTPKIEVYEDCPFYTLKKNVDDAEYNWSDTESSESSHSHVSSSYSQYSEQQEAITAGQDLLTSSGEFDSISSESEKPEAVAAPTKRTMHLSRTPVAALIKPVPRVAAVSVPRSHRGTSSDLQSEDPVSKSNEIIGKPLFNARHTAMMSTVRTVHISNTQVTTFRKPALNNVVANAEKGMDSPSLSSDGFLSDLSVSNSSELVKKPLATQSISTSGQPSLSDLDSVSSDDLNSVVSDYSSVKHHALSSSDLSGQEE